MSELHSDLSGADLHGPFQYEQDADPGAVGAGVYWLDTNSGPPRILHRRNAADDGWDEVGGSSGAVTDHGALTGLSDDDHPQYVLESLLDAKGDLYVASAADTPARLAVGANGTKLVADSAESTGLKYEGFVGARIYNSATQSIANNAVTPLTFDSERFDTNTFHFTSAANLTGTVAKTSGSATLTGTGTAFTSELSVGQMIDVPGTATERRVVTAIASDTSLTVASNFANSASGQTAARVNTGLVVPSGHAGKYLLGMSAQFQPNATGQVQIRLRLNGSTIIGLARHPNNSAINQTCEIVTPYDLAVWDYVEACVFQNSGGALDAEANANYHPVFWMLKVA